MLRDSFSLCIQGESSIDTLGGPSRADEAHRDTLSLFAAVLDVGTGLARPLDALDDIDISSPLSLFLSDVVRAEIECYCLTVSYS